ncbi:MAG TPA: glycine cleavage system protein GcvH [bacterium]|nr:glycine cleavage system protein GcvH [bacterium]
MIPADRRYTRDHTWLQAANNIVTVGITDHGQEQLADIVFVDLPDVGRKVKAGDSLALVETTKTPQAGVPCPITGTVLEVNEELVPHPEKINESPYEEGWIFRLKVSNADLSRFMDAAAYEAFLAQKG